MMAMRGISLENFQSKLGSLRYSDYFCIITEIQDDLNLPEETTLEEMESLLIKATKECFDDTLEGDITLMALGLLEGFYHHKPRGGAKKEFPIKQRRIKFLNESSYLEEEYNGQYNSYEDIEKAGSKTVKQIFDKLGKTEDRCIYKVAAKIYNKSESQLKKYMPINKIDLPKCKSIPLSINNGIHADSAEDKNSVSSSTIESNTSSMKDATDTVQFEGHTYNTENVIANSNGETFVGKHDNVTVNVNISNMGFVSGAENTNRNLPPVEHIFVSTEGVNLEPYGTYTIETAVLPREAQNSFLSYVSSNTSIATVSAEGIIKAKDKCGTVIITIQAESGCTAKVPVIVKSDKQENNDNQKLPGWGPERPIYTNERPAAFAVFNSIVDNALVGDERNFVRIEEKSSGRPYSSNIEIEAGKQYEVYIYYHNDASESYNGKEHKYAGVARNVRLSTMFPTVLSAGERGAVTGKIMSDNTVPAAVWDAAHITAKQDMTLHYVSGSAKIYNQWDANGSVLAMAFFSPRGVLIGLNELNGVILGGSKYSGQVVYTIQTRAIKDH